MSDLGFLEALKVDYLEALSLVGASFTESDLITISGLKHLSGLNLFKTNIDDHGLSILSSMPLLSSLNLNNTKVSGAGISSLLNMRRLRTVHIAGTKITSNGFMRLSEGQLSVDISTHQVTLDDVKEFISRKQGDWFFLERNGVYSIHEDKHW